MPLNSQKGNQILIGLLTAALLALSVPLGLVAWALFSSNIGLTQTGQIGDTFGGTAGALLNFMGLVLVYYSFKEQLQANKQQKEQQDYELTYKLLEPFLSLIAQNSDLFTELPQLEFKRRLGFSSPEESQKLPLGFDLLELRQSQLRQIASYFYLIKNRLNLLTADQRQAVVQTIYDSYAYWLIACYGSYVLHFCGVSAKPETTKLEEVTKLGAKNVGSVRKQLDDLRQMADDANLELTDNSNLVS